MTISEPMPDAKTGAEPSGAWAQSAKLAFRFLFLAVCLAAVGWSVSNFRQIPPESRALIYRFGQLVRQQGSGLLMAWPEPVERVVILPSEDRQLEFRIDQFEPDSAVGGDFMISDYARENVAFLLTGDAGVVQQSSACGVGALGELLEHELTRVGKGQERGAHVIGIG